jgi:hypothetical protein
MACELQPISITSKIVCKLFSHPHPKIVKYWITKNDYFVKIPQYGSSHIKGISFFKEGIGRSEI